MSSVVTKTKAQMESLEQHIEAVLLIAKLAHTYHELGYDELEKAVDGISDGTYENYDTFADALHDSTVDTHLQDLIVELDTRLYHLLRQEEVFDAYSNPVWNVYNVLAKQWRISVT